MIASGVMEILVIRLAESFAQGTENVNSCNPAVCIMKKIAGISLVQVYEQIKIPDKLQIVTQLFRLQKTWLSASFVEIGSLYYAKDAEAGRSKRCLFIDGNGHEVRDERFVIGPATGRDWIDEGRFTLKSDRSPCKAGVVL